LDEVVLGVQFEPAAGYSSVMAKDVWSLFSDEFTQVQEHPAIAPQFELFGREGSRPAKPAIRLESAPIRGRLWFISEDENHLIQFQDDRLLLNWRRRENGAEYPRFEGTSASLVKYLRRLHELFISSFGAGLAINQAEASYINIIPVERFEEVGDFLQVLNLSDINVEGFNLNFTEAVRDEAQKPFARLHHEFSTGFYRDNSKQKVLRLGLTCRGRPSNTGIEGALEFLTIARGKIVERFSELATEQAERTWGRKS